MRNIAVFDIDGVLSNDAWRQQYLDDPNDPTWNRYYEGAQDDDVIEAGRFALFEAWESGWDIYFSTGMPERYREDRQKWLETNFEFLEREINYTLLMAADAHQHLHNADVKAVHANQIGPDRIVVWRDDNPETVQRLWEIGVPAVWVPSSGWKNKAEPQFPYSFTQYAEDIKQVAKYADHDMPGVVEKPIVYTTLGLTGESGELLEKATAVFLLAAQTSAHAGVAADTLKKVVRNNDGVFTPDKVDAILKEVGDVLWYTTRLPHHLGSSLEQVARDNVAKLLDRLDRNVIKGEGDNR